MSSCPLIVFSAYYGRARAEGAGLIRLEWALSHERLASIKTSLHRGESSACCFLRSRITHIIRSLSAS